MSRPVKDITEPRRRDSDDLRGVAQELRKSEERRAETQRLRAQLTAARQSLADKRRQLGEADQYISQMQREREDTRRQCFELEESILDILARAIILQSSGESVLPSFIELADAGGGKGVRIG